jgi:hypothetical protein
MTRHKKIAMTIILIGGGLICLEIFIRSVRRIYPFSLTGMTALTCQRSYFSDHLAKPTEPLTPGENFFDPLTDWRNGLSEGAIARGYQINRQGFRSSYDFSETKTKPRIAILGDSFTFGTAIKNHETISVRLEELFNHKVEVMNFGVEGHSVLQMALVATQILPAYKPDAVVVAFIAQDLERSCKTCHGAVALPTIRKKNDSIVLAGVPVASPTDLLNARNQFSERLKDKIIGKLRSSFLLSVLFELPYLIWEKNCIEERNLLAFEMIEKQFPNIPVLFAHIYRPIPDPDLEKRLRTHVRHYVSVLEKEERISQETGLKLDKSDFFHPGPERTKIHAMIYSEYLKKISDLPR